MICGQVGKQFNLPDFEMHGMFHNIIWVGDLNYRFGDLEIDQLEKYMVSHQRELMLEKLDELNKERMKNLIFYQFKEPEMSPTFYPTYKKYEKRKFFRVTEDGWFRNTYRVLYKEPWYKSGKIKKRIPGFTDRIFYYQSPFYEF